MSDDTDRANPIRTLNIAYCLHEEIYEMVDQVADLSNTYVTSKNHTAARWPGCSATITTTMRVA